MHGVVIEVDAPRSFWEVTKTGLRFRAETDDEKRIREWREHFGILAWTADA